ncbi:Gamma-glutamyl cyclotransferase gliK [Metarhizium anisopliae]
MASSTFIKKRQINPLRSEVAMIKDHVLSFSVLQMPYSEPAMAGIRRRTPNDDRNDVPHVIGVAYQLRKADWARIIATEGGGIAYTAAQMAATLIGIGHEPPIPVLVWTLVPTIPHSLERLPSARYMVRPTTTIKAQPACCRGFQL